MIKRNEPTMKRYLLIALLMACGMARGVCGDEFMTSYVDTRVGTAASVTHTAGLFGKQTEEYGQTLPAVLEPNGMTFWTPQTRDTETKCVAPYYYGDTLLQGFRASHWIVGGCTQDYGSVTLMAESDSLRCLPEARATTMSHDDEVARPDYYAVTLADEGIRAEMTGRCRTAIYRFTYSKAGKGYLVVNPNSDEGEAEIALDPRKGRIYGSNPVHRIYQGWGEEAGFSGYFVVYFKKSITAFGSYEGETICRDEGRVTGKKDSGVWIEFDVAEGEEVIVKVATSFVSCEGADINLAQELPHWDFDRTHNELLEIWQQRLRLIQVESSDDDAKQKFYGALYRASFLPRTMNDVDGRYPSFAAGTPILQTNNTTYYDDYSLWDTFRALHPLITLLTPLRSGEMMQSLIDKYIQGGWMPIFPCWNSYTAAMIGDHTLSAISDAYIKGIRNFDLTNGYAGMRQNAFDSPSSADYKDGKGRRALTSYLKYGYIPLEDSVPDAFHTKEQVSRTMEYAYDDFCLAQIARSLGRNNDYKKLMARAKNYQNVIDPRTGYAQGRHANGQFLDDDDAFSFASFITEGAPCHYTWYAPHDPYGLMALMGGREKYVAKLDSMFSQNRYWHGNEPCHQIAFMFNYAGQPWKTQKAVRHILDTEYLNLPGGLSGNDDAGQMSAWYVFAAMGFYPVCPGTPYYMLASPTFPLVAICPEGGETFTIHAINASAENIYIQSATLNGEPYTKNYLSHADIARGGMLELVMGNTPNTTWGAAADDCPPDVMTTKKTKR